MATFGCDSNTTSNSCGNGVYFLPLGGETTAYSNLPTPPAGATVYVYWNIGGPGNAPSGQSPTGWGETQALAFQSAYNTYGASGTPFGSFSVNTGGWSTSTLSENADVLSAFLAILVDAIADPGIYLNQNRYDTYLPSGYKFPSSYTLWQAAWYSGSTPPSCSTVSSDWANNTFGLGLGGLQATWWQYFGNPDYDIGG
jgi:hypothetical protein